MKPSKIAINKANRDIHAALALLASACDAMRDAARNAACRRDQRQLFDSRIAVCHAAHKMEIYAYAMEARKDAESWETNLQNMLNYEFGKFRKSIIYSRSAVG